MDLFDGLDSCVPITIIATIVLALFVCVGVVLSSGLLGGPMD